MNDLFTIGEISKHQNISRQTLIFYDKIGLFRPAYVDPENGYRYYSAAQLDYLDTICIMKKFGFSLDEIKAHMKSYTLDTSLIALRKQLTIIDRQIKDLQLIKSRVAHRCAQLEQSASIHSGSAAVSVETVKSQHLLLQEVASPYTLEAGQHCHQAMLRPLVQGPAPHFLPERSDRAAFAHTGRALYRGLLRLFAD